MLATSMASCAASCKVNGAWGTDEKQRLRRGSNSITLADNIFETWGACVSRLRGCLKAPTHQPDPGNAGVGMSIPTHIEARL